MSFETQVLAILKPPSVAAELAFTVLIGTFIINIIIILFLIF